MPYKVNVDNTIFGLNDFDNKTMYDFANTLMSIKCKNLIS